MAPPRAVELTDLLVRRDADGARLPVPVTEVVARLEASGQRRAARIARRLPARDGRLDDSAIDELLLRVHRELQRLSEELQQPRRVAETLRDWTVPLLGAADAPVRVVDVGCGIGFTVRWLAAHNPLPGRVELVGVDRDATLVRHARELAAAEGLRCRFVVGDAFRPGLVVDDPGRTLVVSAGLVHHLPPDELPDFFAAQQRLGVRAFGHWDADPSGWAVLGARIFHRARMREPVSRHDGVLSVQRAHPSAVLRAAAAAGAPDYAVTCTDAPRWRPVLTEVLRPVTGLLREKRPGQVR